MNVQQVIKEHGFTITQCAEKMGISRVTLAQNLARNPTVSTLQRIADTIGCHVGDFFADEIESPPPTRCPHCGKLINVVIEKP